MTSPELRDAILVAVLGQSEAMALEDASRPRPYRNRHEISGPAASRTKTLATLGLMDETLKLLDIDLPSA